MNSNYNLYYNIDNSECKNDKEAANNCTGTV